MAQGSIGNALGVVKLWALLLYIIYIVECRRRWRNSVPFLRFLRFLQAATQPSGSLGSLQNCTCVERQTFLFFRARSLRAWVLTPRPHPSDGHTVPPQGPPGRYWLLMSWVVLSRDCWACPLPLFPAKVLGW